MQDQLLSYVPSSQSTELETVESACESRFLSEDILVIKLIIPHLDFVLTMNIFKVTMNKI